MTESTAVRLRCRWCDSPREEEYPCKCPHCDYPCRNPRPCPLCRLAHELTDNRNP